MKIRTKSLVLDGVQWMHHGDHSGVDEYPPVNNGVLCGVCNTPLNAHGWIKTTGTIDGGYRICPGDWVITGLLGDLFRCKSEDFPNGFEIVDDA